MSETTPLNAAALAPLVPLARPVGDRHSTALAGVLALMARLRDPVNGCPWDLAQNFATIAPYTIEEAYEVADAIAREDLSNLKEELGDLLFQVVFHARLAEERGAFDFADVAETLITKMVSRHPHVFGSASARTAEEQTAHWEAQKAAERAAKAGAIQSVLADVPLALPALTRAEKLTKRAARIGFDWPDAASVFAKLDEERAELEAAMTSGNQAHIAEEFGDLMFVIANLARKLDLDPETSLRAANHKFERRFVALEDLARAGGLTGVQPLDVLEALWQQVKAAETPR